MERAASGRRKSSASKLDKEKLQQLKLFQQSGGIASKLLKIRAAADESAAAAISLSKVMARKKGAEVSLQIEIETEAHWKLLLRREGLIVVEVYAGWCGPCLSMVNILKKVKVDANDDRLTLATVNSENISELRIFKGQSEPAWVFMGGGKAVKLLRGSNAAQLVTTIKSEFKHELLCMEGKVKRNLISIQEEAERRHRAQSEALYLATEQKKQHALEQQALLPPLVEPELVVTKSRSVSPHPLEETQEMSEEKVIEEKVEEPEEDIEDIDHFQDSSTEATTARMEKSAREAAAEGMNVRLATAMESFAVLAIQGFLLETGAVTEIKDELPEFKIIKERYIFLEEAGVRDLFGIPYYVEELVEEEEETDSEQAPEEVEEGDEANETSSVITDTLVDKLEEEEGEGLPQEEVKEEVKVPKYIKVPVPLPEELVGDTLLFILESLEVMRLKEENPEATLAKTADDHLRLRVGPNSYKEAVDSEPKSLLAIYGREEYAVGVWCPKSYEHKKFVMLEFFPQFVTDLLMPPEKELPKYMLAIFPSLFSNEIMEHPELLNNAKDVIAQRKTLLPPKLVNKILRSRGIGGEDLEAQKKALTGFNMFVLSIDARNEDLVSVLDSLEPLHYSVNNENGRFETAKIFPHLNILIDSDYDEDVYKRELIVEKFLCRPKLKLDAILDDDIFEDNEDE